MEVTSVIGLCGPDIIELGCCMLARLKITSCIPCRWSWQSEQPLYSSSLASPAASLG